MITIILITILLALLIAYPLKKRTKLPPGPFPFPFLGNLPQVGLLAAKHGGIVAAMKQLKKEYGPVFTIWLGPQPTVHIATMDLAQETMVKRGGEFTQRWVPLLFNAVRKGLGIVGTSGDHWTEQRRFALHTLRNFGLGRSIMEERIMAEVNWRCESIDKEIGTKTVVMSPHDMFDLMVGSIINRMLFSEPLDGENGEEFHSLKRSIDKFVENVSILDFFLNNEFAFKLPILRTRYQKLTAPQRDLKAFIEKRVKERLFDIESGSRVIPDEPEDYVDAFLLKMKQEEKESGPSSFNVPSLTINLFDLWIAGQETTVTTLISGFAFLLNNLDVIEKIKEELLRVTKGERDLSLLDRPNTPYYNATITEIQRHASILNINLFRRTEEDTYVGGFIVEKGTPLTAEISLLMSDEKFFKDDKFDPTRFLTNDKLDQHVTPFGMGKRSCPGESLARAELYLIIGNMLLRYNIQPTECLPATASKNNCGVLKRPSEYQMRIGKAEGRV